MQKGKKQERIDALGLQAGRNAALSKLLLSETENQELNAIVEEAARTLSAPIALVNLVLEEIQFFKAHYGLPDDLQATRATSRDVSFCQFVVRDGKPFEVNDAENDPRIPQYLVQHYGLNAYLGVPVQVNDVIVGSLCVIDVQPREFSEEDVDTLEKLAEHVNQHLANLGGIQENEVDQGLLEKAALPALREIYEALMPIQTETAKGHLAITVLKSLRQQLEFELGGGKLRPETKREALNTVKTAIGKLQDGLYNIEMGVADAVDPLLALEHMLTRSGTTDLEDIVLSGYELARGNTKGSGGVYVPDVQYNPRILTMRPLAVSLVAFCISMMSGKLQELASRERIELSFFKFKNSAGISFRSKGLTHAHCKGITSVLTTYIGQHQSINIDVEQQEIRLFFATVTEALATPRKRTRS